MKEIQHVSKIFKNILINGRTNNNVFTGNIYSKNQDLNFDFNGLVDYSESLKKLNFTVDIENYKIDIGEKSKIKKISFIGNKKFKNSKLRNVIVSEEYKFWKFLSGKKFLNESLINFDSRLLKNFYLNNGYYNVKINQSYAKLLNDKSLSKKKVLEEINELIEAVENDTNKIYEAADVFYHLIMYLEANEIKIEDVMEELNKRKK